MGVVVLVFLNISLSYIMVSRARQLLVRNYSCPDVHDLRRPFHYSSSFTKPKRMPTATSTFDISLSHDRRSCNSFRINIRGTDSIRCSMSESNTRAAAEPRLDEWVHGNLGPDAFQVMIDGAERTMMVTPSKYLGNCSYDFDSILQNAAPTWISMTHLYEVSIPLVVCT